VGKPDYRALLSLSPNAPDAPGERLILASVPDLVLVQPLLSLGAVAGGVDQS